MLYLSQMIYMGRSGGTRLTDAQFEAWDYGPVEPNLYHRAKRFGSDSLDDIFYDALGFKDDDPRRLAMNNVYERFSTFSPGDLVEITHWDEGAWAKHYVPRARRIRIPDSDILEEYHTRQGTA